MAKSKDTHSPAAPKYSACQSCKLRKVRCSLATPACEACLRSARFEGRDPSTVVCVYGGRDSPPRSKGKKLSSTSSKLRTIKTRSKSSVTSPKTLIMSPASVSSAIMSAPNSPVSSDTWDAHESHAPAALSSDTSTTETCANARSIKNIISFRTVTVPEPPARPYPGPEPQEMFPEAPPQVNPYQMYSSMPIISSAWPPLDTPILPPEAIHNLPPHHPTWMAHPHSPSLSEMTYSPVSEFDEILPELTNEYLYTPDLMMDQQLWLQRIPQVLGSIKNNYSENVLFLPELDWDLSMSQSGQSLMM